MGAAEDGMELTRPCVHCGICLPACPTYGVLKEEADSPRGRVLLLDEFLAGRVDAAAVKPYIDRCIGCRACETACPSGVQYGELLEVGRARLGGPDLRTRLFLKLIGRRWTAAALAMGGRLAGRLPKRRTAPWPDRPSSPRATIRLQPGCITPYVFPHLAAEAARVLAHLGYAVETVPGCCGALHRHAGLQPPKPREQLEGLVSLAAGCSATPGMRDLCALLLDELPIARLKLPPVRVAYDAPCHLLHGQGIDAAPLLDAIDGVERVPLDDSQRCCGAGGLYMEQQPELARRVRAEKLDAIERSGAEVVATPNPGCMIWLWRGLRARRLAVEVVHPVTLLARATA